MWLNIHQLTAEEYMKRVHSVNKEVNYLVSKELTEAIREYHLFSLNNPTVKITDFLDAVYGIEYFNKRWLKQLDL